MFDTYRLQLLPPVASTTCGSALPVFLAVDRPQPVAGTAVSLSLFFCPCGFAVADRCPLCGRPLSSEKVDCASSMRGDPPMHCHVGCRLSALED